MKRYKSESGLLQECDSGPYVLHSDADAEIGHLRHWIDDLQSGMYINCVYCGHRYGPRESTPESMAEVLKQHIEVCPEHPMSKLKAENERLREALTLHRHTDACLEFAAKTGEVGCIGGCMVSRANVLSDTQALAATAQGGKDGEM